MIFSSVRCHYVDQVIELFSDLANHLTASDEYGRPIGCANRCYASQFFCAAVATAQLMSHRDVLSKYIDWSFFHVAQ